MADAPLDEERRKLTAGWGSFGQGRTVMPGRGKVTPCHPAPGEVEAWERGPTGPRPQSYSSAHRENYYLTIHVNAQVRWECVPRAVWEYTLGGYQVVKKWLSYREYKVLGRPLHDDELREVQNMLRRIAALLLLGPELDANYAAVKADTYPWPAG